MNDQSKLTKHIRVKGTRQCCSLQAAIPKLSCPHRTSCALPLTPEGGLVFCISLLQLQPQLTQNLFQKKGHERKCVHGAAFSTEVKEGSIYFYRCWMSSGLGSRIFLLGKSEIIRFLVEFKSMLIWTEAYRTYLIVLANSEQFVLCHGYLKCRRHLHMKYRHFRIHLLHLYISLSTVGSRKSGKEMNSWGTAAPALQHR